MIDVACFKKNKISLNDYDYKGDLRNRQLMSHFTINDLLVLEEILYSPLKLSLHKLSEEVCIEKEHLIPLLEKFSSIGLLTFCNRDEMMIDKEMRKYYETQMLKFEEGFVPGMEFLQSLLRKVPIHVLPHWYSIPRGSNNIFDSIVEKYLITPHVFEKYTQEHLQSDPLFASIIETVYNAPDLKMSGSAIMNAYQLSRKEFDELMLHLEFNFLSCLSYEKIGHEWQEILTPFHEWREYLRFLQRTEVTPLTRDALIEKTALLNRCSEIEIPSSLRTDKNLREIEKSLSRVAKKGWVYFDDFLKGVLAPLTEKTAVQLKRSGKAWGYALPEYTEVEKAFIKETIFCNLPKTGLILTGKHCGKDCFRVQ